MTLQLFPSFSWYVDVAFYVVFIVSVGDGLVWGCRSICVNVCRGFGLGSVFRSGRLRTMT